MFPEPILPTKSSFSFPRVRGDVPEDLDRLEGKNMFSPRTRGCSLVFSMSVPTRLVFPAYAGMFPFQIFLRIS